MAGDPCAEADELRVARRKLATGEKVVEVGYGEDRVRYGRGDADLLDRLIAQAERECDLSKGGRKRRRFAMGARFRPY